MIALYEMTLNSTIEKEKNLNKFETGKKSLLLSMAFLNKDE